MYDTTSMIFSMKKELEMLTNCYLVIAYNKKKKKTRYTCQLLTHHNAYMIEVK